MKSFGLSDKEISLYLAVLANGPTTATNLARASALKRPTVYVLLETLLDRGLLSQERLNGKQFFKVSSLDKFKDLIDDEFLKIERQRRAIDGLIKELTSFREAGREPAFTSYHEGEGGIFNIFQQVLTSGEEPYFFGNAEALLKKYSDEKWAKIFQPTKKDGDGSKILAEKFRPFQQGLTQEGIQEVQLGFLPPEFEAKAALLIFGNKTAFIALAHYPFGVVIENKEIANMLKFMFGSLWRSGPPKTD